jgi:LysM repeat protein
MTEENKRNKQEEETNREEGIEEEPQVYSVKKGLDGWRFSRRDFLAATAATAAAAAVAGCSGTGSALATPTATKVAIITKIPTNTPAPTATSTPTTMPTATPTRTPTATVTPTDTPTLTATFTPTDTPRPTDTPTHTPTSTPTNTPTPVIHTVQAGDTLIGIAEQYGISVEALQEANDILDPRRLQIGQELVIPREGQALEGIPTSTSTPTTVLLQAQFIGDVTIPDKTVVSPGQAFTKTWRFRNNGTVPWGEGVRLIFVEGEYRGFESNKMDGPDFVNVPNVTPGETVDVSVDLVAPTEAGHYYL